MYANYTEEFGVVACGFVNAKNGFGGYTGFERFVSAGKSVILEERDDIDGAWLDACLGVRQKKGMGKAPIEVAEGDVNDADEASPSDEARDVMAIPFENKDQDKSAPRVVTLAPSDIVTAMRTLQPKVQACANRFRASGTAKVSIAVGPEGKVTSAAIVGRFEDTPAGACVETVALSAKFPPCEPTTFSWPFTLLPR